MKINILLVIFLFFLFSCGKKNIFHEEMEFPNETWEINNKIIFDSEIIDTTKFYNVFIEISNSDEYYYSNLWLFVDIFYENKTFISRDTFEIFLSNNKGKWLGSSFFNDEFTRTKIFKKNIRFLKSGKYNFKFQQAMREEKLISIKKVALKIDEK